MALITALMLSTAAGYSSPRVPVVAGNWKMNPSTSAEAVALAEALEAVDGREVVGLEMWGGADTDGYIWSLRWLGTEEEAVAARTEEVLRDLIRRDLSNNFKHDAWAQQANAQGGNWQV